jgi:hypothetical protein
VRPLVRAAGPPLVAGPVRMEGPRPAAGWDEEGTRFAVLAALALRYLARDEEWP